MCTHSRGHQGNHARRDFRVLINLITLKFLVPQLSTHASVLAGEEELGYDSRDDGIAEWTVPINVNHGTFLVHHEFSNIADSGNEIRTGRYVTG